MLRALTKLAFDEIGLGTGGIAQVHRAVADRAFTGPSASKLLHDAISGAVYGAVRGGAALAGRAAPWSCPSARSRRPCSACSTACRATCSSRRSRSR